MKPIICLKSLYLSYKHFLSQRGIGSCLDSFSIHVRFFSYNFEAYFIPLYSFPQAFAD